MPGFNQRIGSWTAENMALLDLPTHLRIWDLAHAGSPTMATLMSPRSEMPCVENSTKHA